MAQLITTTRHQFGMGIEYRKEWNERDTNSPFGPLQDEEQFWSRTSAGLGSASEELHSRTSTFTNALVMLYIGRSYVHA
uniref:Uncharacterized protein n=1 Tax=Vespula pensylvanica TaxID=30213 RepID=A0A834PFE7_VESPE|nr:hypothetical protein H0235_001046 [Vespula pensylvanica]